MPRKLPSFQFYPGDWMKDPALLRCSHAAQGVWMRMLCLMFECSERGYLIQDDAPWPIDEIAAAVGGDSVSALNAIQELLTKGVAMRDKRGAICSRRMVRDEKERQANREYKRSERSRDTEMSGSCQEVVRRVSDASSSSSSSSKKTPLNPPLLSDLPTQLQTDEFLTAWCDWVQHRREIKKPMKPTQQRHVLEELVKLGQKRGIAAIRHSIAKGWQGLFEEKNASVTPAGGDGKAWKEKPWKP